MTPVELWFSALFSEEVEGSRLDLSPLDPGNFTPAGVLRGSQYGISAREFPDAPFGSLTVAYASRIARAKYWDAHDLDRFPAPVGILMGDSYYNGGHPVEWLQKAVGAHPDGAWGPGSQAAFAGAWTRDWVLVLQRFTACRLAYLSGLQRPDQMEGWAKRCMIMFCTALRARGPEVVLLPTALT